MDLIVCEIEANVKKKKHVYWKKCVAMDSFWTEASHHAPEGFVTTYNRPKTTYPFSTKQLVFETIPQHCQILKSD